MNLGRLSGSLWGPIAFGSLVVVDLSLLTRPCILLGRVEPFPFFMNMLGYCVPHIPVFALSEYFYMWCSI